MVKLILLIYLPTLILCVAGVPYFNTDGANVNLIVTVEDSRNEYEVILNNAAKIILLYESLCPDCIREYPQFLEVVQKLGNYIDLQTYPYGNARMINASDLIVTVECQHGEEECYGNKLHACAIDLLKDVDKYVDFNACLMASHSDDAAAVKCGTLKNVDSEAIKTCANGDKGQELLIHYGKESRKIDYNYVPYVLINGQVKPDDKSLWDAVCESFDKPPMECNK